MSDIIVKVDFLGVLNSQIKQFGALAVSDFEVSRLSDGDFGRNYQKKNVTSQDIAKTITNYF